MSLMSIRRIEPVIIKHKDRFQLRRESIFWDLLDPKNNKPNKHHHAQESVVLSRGLKYPGYLSK